MSCPCSSSVGVMRIVAAGWGGAAAPTRCSSSWSVACVGMWGLPISFSIAPLVAPVSSTRKLARAPHVRHPLHFICNSFSLSLSRSLSLSAIMLWSFREPKQLCPKVYCDVQDPQAWTAAVQKSDLLYFSLKLLTDNVTATCEVGEIQLRVTHCILKRVETLLQGHSRCQLAAELVILSSVSSYLET